MTKNIQFKVEKGRVLVPVGQSCRFACKYCYTRGGEVGPPKVEAEEVLNQFELFACSTSFETIQFGYDGDPFDNSSRGIMMLKRLASMGKNISFSTKALVEKEILTELKGIKDVLSSSGNSFVAFISLSCWNSAYIVEPHTPTPYERMVSVTNLKSIGIPTFIALRPILPNIPNSEYETLLEEGIKAGCDGFILGPLYADDKGQFVRFIRPEILERIPGRKVLVKWSAHEPEWIRYEDEARLSEIETMVEKKRGRVFLSSVDAVELIQKGMVYNDRSRIEMQAFP